MNILKEIISKIEPWNTTSVNCDYIEDELRSLLGGYVKEIKRLSDGYTNVSFFIIDNNDDKYKLSVFVNEESYLSENKLREFLQNRKRIYDIYGSKLGIIYHDINKVLSLFIDGTVATSALKENSGDTGRLISFTEAIIKNIDKFHNDMELVHDFKYLDLTGLFYDSLKEQNLIEKGTIPDDVILEKIKLIRKFEESFSEEWFALSHRDTDPINMIYIPETGEFRHIDFEFTGKGLKYYDYANCYNVLKNINVVGDEVLEGFKENLLSFKPEFNIEDFQTSVNIMTFIWGLWYYLYGLKFNDDRLTKIGIDWINELK
ncbi:MAG: hypothetical protein FWD38_01070 [Oscillospiraceae bacterium]|nr:hypothetical protein [Oscillospiraceae bacterium]